MDKGVSPTGPGHSDEPASSLAADAGSVPNAVLYCDFCAKSQHEVERLIMGPTAGICNECAELCRDIAREEIKAHAGRRGISCPGCGEGIDMIAAVGRDQRWGLTAHPGPGGLIQAKTVAGAIQGAQAMMAAACKEDGYKAQTYVESIDTNQVDGSIRFQFATLPLSKRWASANERGPVAESHAPEHPRHSVVSDGGE